MPNDRMRRALTISPYGTKHPTTGGTKRIHYLNRGYAAAGWNIYQISNASIRSGVGGLIKDKDKMIAPGYVEGIYFNPAILIANRILKRLDTAQVAASLLPRQLMRSRQVARGMADHQIIFFEHPQNWDLGAPYLRDDHFVVLDAHNIEWRIWKDQQGQSGWAGRAARALYDVERRAMRRSNLVFTCSDLDREFAIDDFGCDPAKVVVAPNGVDCASFAPIDAARSGRLGRRDDNRVPRALFMGSNWGPNIEAARTVLELASRLPEVQFDIVGSVGDALSGPFPGNVTVSGSVDVLDPYFIAADIALNPMASGSGSNVKMFEYLAAGLPIVTTPFGARGVDDSTGLAVSIADMSQFTAAVRQLVAATDLEERSRAARRLAEQQYDWAAIAKNVIARIEAELGW